MEPARHRHPRALAVVGLVAGLVILVGAFLDGGLATPSRLDVRDPSAAEPATSGPAAPSTASREDRASWDLAPPLLPAPPVAVATLLGAAALALVVLRGDDARRPAPVPVVVRHRGPPAR